MTTLYYDELFLEHNPGIPHPERPERLVAIWDRLTKEGLVDRCTRANAEPVSEEELRRIHSEEQLRFAMNASHAGGGYLDVDTPVSARSWDAARLAAGMAESAVDVVLTGKDTNAFCLVRPPGHHATPQRSMGFCIVNNVAVAATHALEKHDLSHVLVVDWDVHHGNGTQDIFYEDSRVLFFSAHRYPFYPGSGADDETGTGPGLGFTLNLPIRYGTSAKQYHDAFARVLEDAVSRSKPELILLSAGFDAHHDDPVGSLSLDEEDFVDLTRLVRQAAEAHCKGRLVSLLEGGYNVHALADCVAGHVEALLET